MFERLEARAARAVEARVADRRTALAAQLRTILPSSVSVEAGEEGVILSGPGIGRRVMLESGLRWTIAGLLK
jgi:hypothetical protein